MRVLGIDPGVHGALALYDDDLDTCWVEDMPIVVLDKGASSRRRAIRTRVVPAGVIARIRDLCPDIAYLEDVHAMPGQGVSSTFAFGRSFGIMETAVAAVGVPIAYVSPAVWSRALGVVGRSGDASRQRAVQIWPHLYSRFSRAKDDGRADACLIALYGFTATQHRTKT